VNGGLAMAQIAAQVPFGGVLQDGLQLIDALFFI
jgi:hypothetical protein